MGGGFQEALASKETQELQAETWYTLSMSSYIVLLLLKGGPLQRF